MARVFGLFLAVLLATVFLYISRFWVFDLWGREGLFGIEYLRPGGDILRRELRGTPLATYDLLVWVAGGFVILSVVDNIWSKIRDR